MASSGMAPRDVETEKLAARQRLFGKVRAEKPASACVAFVHSTADF